ncbi:MAG: TRAP transporter TatT component family protein [Lacunisphaera sp.]|nr:TRAP transporter TatT component family protein [Lacunisphaera sp.]
MRRRFFRWLVLLALGLGNAPGARAVSWTPGWTNRPVGPGRTITVEEQASARRLGDAIDSAASARTAIQAWEAIAAAQPGDTEAWTEIGMLRLLEGAAYRQSARDRLVCYQAALQACERAMATNPEFLRRVQGGQTTVEALGALGARDMGAMQFWSTGIFYIFRDCLGFFGRIFNVRQLAGAKEVLLRMDAVDPAWEDYASTFSWGIYYLALPSSQGGDRVKARECFDRAVALGAHRALPRWGRGKYFYGAMGEPAAARADFEAVRAQELNGLAGNRSWNRYFQADAARLLAR